MTKMKILGISALFFGTIGFIWLMIHLAGAPAILDPKGPIASSQRDLLLTATGLMLLVVIPVFVLTAVISYRYRAGNTGASYAPNWDTNKKLEALWWGIPIALVGVLSVIAWVSAHDLDPYAKLNSSEKPVEVQVVALRWKWLFIYPEYDVASINELPVPTNTPINFTISSDAPMNSFWIPQLGGQIYAMNGMSTKLHLQADEPGDYAGVSANISGEGFSDMRFMVKARSKSEFMNDIMNAKSATKKLDMAMYDELQKDSVMETATYYQLEEPDLYDAVIAKYMSSMHSGMNKSEMNQDAVHNDDKMDHSSIDQSTYGESN